MMQSNVEKSPDEKKAEEDFKPLVKISGPVFYPPVNPDNQSLSKEMRYHRKDKMYHLLKKLGPRIKKEKRGKWNVTVETKPNKKEKFSPSKSFWYNYGGWYDQTIGKPCCPTKAPKPEYEKKLIFDPMLTKFRTIRVRKDYEVPGVSEYSHDLSNISPWYKGSKKPISGNFRNGFQNTLTKFNFSSQNRQSGISTKAFQPQGNYQVYKADNTKNEDKCLPPHHDVSNQNALDQWNQEDDDHTTQKSLSLQESLGPVALNIEEMSEKNSEDPVSEFQNQCHIKAKKLDKGKNAKKTIRALNEKRVRIKIPSNTSLNNENKEADFSSRENMVVVYANLFLPPSATLGPGEKGARNKKFAVSPLVKAEKEKTGRNDSTQKPRGFKKCKTKSLGPLKSTASTKKKKDKKYPRNYLECVSSTSTLFRSSQDFISDNRFFYRTKKL